MTSDEINRTIEFILQSQANAVVRMEETDRHFRELTEETNRQIREVSGRIQELSISTSRQIREDREYTDRQIRKLTTSTIQFHEYVKDFIKVVAPILEIQSKRLDRLEGQP